MRDVIPLYVRQMALSRPSETPTRMLVVPLIVGIAIGVLPYFILFLGGQTTFMWIVRWIVSLFSVPGVFVCALLSRGDVEGIIPCMTVVVNAVFYFGIVYLVLLARRRFKLR